MLALPSLVLNCSLLRVIHALPLWVVAATTPNSVAVFQEVEFMCCEFDVFVR
jgi:hypothetical protein